MAIARKLDDLVDKKFNRVYYDESNEAIVFCSPTDTYRLQHEQDCCEDVYVESIVGDLKCLENTPILVAEEVKSQDKTPENIQLPDYADESYTWTFYKFVTLKGYVDVRFFGTSNGYYSESVELVKLNEAGI